MDMQEQAIDSGKMLNLQTATDTENRGDIHKSKQQGRGKLDQDQQRINKGQEPQRDQRQVNGTPFQGMIKAGALKKIRRQAG